MDIEIGKAYTMRNGQGVIIFERDSHAQVFRGRDSSDTIYTWYYDGKSLHGQSNFDLVAQGSIEIFSATGYDPVIDRPDMKTGLHYCSACGGLGVLAGIQQFRIKTSMNSRQVVAYCKECSEKIALFLIRSWEN